MSPAGPAGHEIFTFFVNRCWIKVWLAVGVQPRSGVPYVTPESSWI